MEWEGIANPSAPSRLCRFDSDYRLQYLRGVAQFGQSARFGAGRFAGSTPVTPTKNTGQ